MRTGFTFLFILLLITSCQPKPMEETLKAHPLRLKPGMDLKKEIENYVNRERIEAGWISTCAGSLTDYNIRFANQPEGTAGKGHFEIVSLSGAVGLNGSHLHIAVSDSTGQTTGGHLMPGCVVYTTAEIVILESTQHIFSRENDGTTPYKELQVKPK